MLYLLFPLHGLHKLVQKLLFSFVRPLVEDPDEGLDEVEMLLGLGVDDIFFWSSLLFVLFLCFADL